MARQDGKKEKQHYVPQLLLRPFSFNGKGKIPQVHVFDKKNEKIFQTGINNILAENKFYDVFGGSAEPIISEMEANIAPVFKKLIENKNIKTLTVDEKYWLAVFATSQHLRTKGFRLRQKDLEESLLKKLEENGDKVSEELKSALTVDDESIKEFSIHFFGKNLAEFSETMIHKLWHLIETTPDQPFWIGDNPLVMHNDMDLRPYGNIGFMVRGIQIYIPLSPTLILGMWCPTIMDEFKAEIKKAKRSLEQAKIMNVLSTRPTEMISNQQKQHLQKSVERLEDMISSHEDGTPIPCAPQNVMFYNSLQVGWSDQYIVSSKNDFSLAQRMLRENPATKGGIRIQFG